MPSKSKKPSASAKEQLLLDTIAQLAKQVETMTGKLEALEAHQQAQQAQQRPPGPPVFHAEFNETETYWVRIKPYNPRLGHVRKRQYFDEIGILNGGTGEPGDIPEWKAVSAPVARQLARYKQRDNDPRSPQVLDIVTTAEKEYIDQQESMQRAATLGVSGMSPTQVIAQAQQQITPRSKAPPPPPTLPDRREPPSIIEGASRFAPGTPGAPAVPPPLQVPGRMAALQGLPDAAPTPTPTPVPTPTPAPTMTPTPVPTPTAPQMAPAPVPPRNDGGRGVEEDLTPLAEQDPDVQEAMAELAKYNDQKYLDQLKAADQE